MMNSFWKGKKVLVTGHTGFKGSWLCLWLYAAGADIVGYSLTPPTQPNLFELARIEDDIVSVGADVRDLRQLVSVVAEHRPEIVIHMAAQAIVRTSYRDPLGTYSTNVMGTANVLEAIRLNPTARAVVVVTSDKCYENRERTTGYLETAALGGRDPYSSSKACAELVSRAYRDSFFAVAEPEVFLATVRAGNVIGGGDWADARVVPDMVRAAIGCRPLHVRYPRAVRPWQHVLDPVGGYLHLAELLYLHGAEFADAWNFAPDGDDLLTVGDLVEQFRSLWDQEIEVSIDPGPHAHEHGLLLLDAGKARRLLGWCPKLSQAEALRWVVDWYSAYRAKSDMREVTDHQIERYQAIEAAVRPSSIA